MENKIPHLEWNGIVTALSRLVHDGWGTALVLDFGNRHRRDRGACGHLVSPTLLRQGKLGNRSSAYRLGGCKVLTDGGCIALPILHQVQRVSMQTATVTTSRTGGDAVLTADQLRADIVMKFELRVAPNDDNIATAAQVLGHRIARSGEVFADVLAGSLVNAIQSVAATRDLGDIHLNRAEFTHDVSEMISDHAQRLGLTLVSASLVG